MERPLSDDVARPARAYLAALVPPDEVSDAWHELLADVAYWDDRQLLPVLRLAHQVVLQHERVTPEVAALVLVETGIDRPEDVAAVLDTDVDRAGAWTRDALATRDAQDEPTTSAAAPAAARTTATAAAPVAPPTTPPTPVAEPAPAPRADQPVEPVTPTPTTPDGEAVRIGFDEDGPVPELDTGGRRRLPTGTVVLGALVLWVLVAVLWSLAR